MELLFRIYGRCFLAVGDILWAYFKGGGERYFICREGVEAKGAGYGEGGGLFLFFIFLQGRGGVNIIVWVRGGLTGRGEGGEDYDDWFW